VQIHELELLGRTAEHLELSVRCSKGTYVRALAEDIGTALGTGAHLAALRRTGAGRFSVRDAIALDALERLADPRSALLPLSALLAGLQRADLDAGGEMRLRNGQALKISGLSAGLCALYGAGGRVIGLGMAQEQGTLKALRLTRGLTQAAEKHRKTL
jgi:tRNA pseudouridine55 synthase